MWGLSVPPWGRGPLVPAQPGRDCRAGRGSRRSVSQDLRVVDACLLPLTLPVTMASPLLGWNLGNDYLSSKKSFVHTSLGLCSVRKCPVLCLITFALLLASLKLGLERGLGRP